VEETTVSNNKKSLVTPFGVLVLSFLTLPLLGCQRDTGRKDVPTPSLEARVKAIENNPDMPPNIKATAIQQIKAVEGGLQAASAAQKEEKKSP
jgi:hypothetical protein